MAAQGRTIGQRIMSWGSCQEKSKTDFFRTYLGNDAVHFNRPPKGMSIKGGTSKLKNKLAYPPSYSN